MQMVNSSCIEFQAGFQFAHSRFQYLFILFDDVLP